ncbi:MAG: hypothetical protein RBG13Loki_0694 [Promethearchaeota archaeon CR_4]|nr:MAG: hypothetical protein RBG13Loki_0694 [Candidatus Lokiarchaeota archaeon CR_4]
MTLKKSSTLSRTKPIEKYSLVIKCTTLIPRFFTNIPSDAVSTRQKLLAITNSIDLQPLENGFLIHAPNLSSLQSACSQLWQIDLNTATSVREFGLWDVEIVRNASEENVQILNRWARLLCEKVFHRKPVEVCKSNSS